MEANNVNCNFFVQRKKRFCKMTVKPGKRFCGEHQPIDASDQKEEDKNRIPCPLDPKHTCFADKLESHLKVCNARPKDLPPYIVKNCNLETSLNEVDITTKRLLSSVPKEDILDVIKIIEKIYKELIDGKIENFVDEKINEFVTSEIERQDRAHGSKRHLYQTSALLNIIKTQSLLNNGTCFVELGAGKGHLSFYLAKMFVQEKDCSILLIDKASHRHKQDNKLDKDSLQVDRIRADISDLMISEVPLVKSASGLVGVSKHLCGAATDIALKCLTNSNIVEKCQGMLMATCCHHRCMWESYVGKDFLKKYEIDKTKFDIICGLVSWATCGTGLSREKRAKLNNETNKKEQTDKEIKNNNPQGKISASMNLGFNLTQREDVGYKSKYVLDWGRLQFLKGLGFSGELNFYVTRDISPENVCMIIKKKNNVL